MMLEDKGMSRLTFLEVYSSVFNISGIYIAFELCFKDDVEEKAEWTYTMNFDDESEERVVVLFGMKVKRRRKKKSSSY